MLGPQTKLRVSQPGDIHEREADRVANQVMTSPIQGNEPFQIRQLSTESSAQGSTVPGSVSRVIAGTASPVSGVGLFTEAGRPLSQSLRAFFEPRLGYDLSQVRVHADAHAASFSHTLGARAFTIGGNVAFGAGEFSSSTHEGRRLLAHELVHVIQQNGPSRGTIQRQPKKKAATGGQQIVIIANGYSSSSAKKEIEDAKKGLWLPSTKDFTVTAFDTQKHFSGASTADEFFGALQGAKGKIGRIVFIGHGNTDGLGLSGKPGDFFQETLVESDLNRWQSSIDSDIKPKLMDDAILDIYACNLALKGAFIKAIAQSLGICVRAFSGAVNWCLGFDSDAITSRGRLAGSRIAADCSDSRWNKGVNSFAPPNKTCP